MIRYLLLVGLLSLFCCAEPSTSGWVPTSNVMAAEVTGYNILPPDEFCAYVVALPDRNGITGFRFVGNVVRVLGEAESLPVRERMCTAESTYCWIGGMVEVAVTQVFSGPLEIGDRMNVLVSPLMPEETERLFAGRRIAVFAPMLRADLEDAATASFYAVYPIDRGWVFGLDERCLSGEFGQEPLGEERFLATVRGYLENPSTCAWVPRQDPPDSGISDGVDEDNSGASDETFWN